MAFIKPVARLLVDGYNVIGTWSELKQIRDQEGLDMAREHLINLLINYTAFEGYETQIVFDAHLQKTPGYQENYTSQLSVYYTGFGQTADTYIEKVCAGSRNLHNRSIPRLIVATSDRAQQLTAIGYGAEWLSSQELVVATQKTKRKTKQKSRSSGKSRGRFLIHTLDIQAQQKLLQLRMGG